MVEVGRMAEIGAGNIDPAHGSPEFGLTEPESQADGVAVGALLVGQAGSG